jgi:hypothetical protein
MRWKSIESLPRKLVMSVFCKKEKESCDEANVGKCSCSKNGDNVQHSFNGPLMLPRPLRETSNQVLPDGSTLSTSQHHPHEVGPFAVRPASIRANKDVFTGLKDSHRWECVFSISGILFESESRRSSAVLGHRDAKQQPVPAKHMRGAGLARTLLSNASGEGRPFLQRLVSS